MKFKKVTAALLLTAILISGVSCAKEKGEDLEQTLIPETVEALSPDAFTTYLDDEDSLALVTALRKTFDDVEESAEADFSVRIENGEAVVLAYLGNAESVRIPQKIKGATVTAVADAAFAEKTTLKQLYLPDSITELGEGVLRGCTALAALRTPLLGQHRDADQYLGYLFGGETYETHSATVPATLAYLELGGSLNRLADYALFDCNDLVCLTLPETMTAIGSYTLYNCSSLLAFNADHLVTLSTHALDSCGALTVLIFGDALTEIGLGALEGCLDLRTLVLPFVGGSRTENSYLGYLFGATVPDHAKDHYPRYLSTVEVLDGCQALGDYAFYNCETLTCVYLHDGLQRIGVRAFAGCERLGEISLPSSISTIRENAFFGCISLVSVKFGTDSMLADIGINAFYKCSALTEISLPTCLRKLPASCFAECLSLKRISLGGVTQIGKNAFRHCQSLAEIMTQSEVVLESGNGFAERILYPKEEE